MPEFYQQRAEDYAKRLGLKPLAAQQRVDEMLNRWSRGGMTTNARAERLVENLSKPVPRKQGKQAPRQNLHHGNQLKSDERALRDGFTEDGFVGPQEPSV